MRHEAKGRRLQTCHRVRPSTMDQMITAVAKPFAEALWQRPGMPKRAVTELIDKGLARIHVEGMPPLIEVTLVLTEEGSRVKTVLERKR
jgi:hypothetical protein